MVVSRSWGILKGVGLLPFKFPQLGGLSNSGGLLAYHHSRKLTLPRQDLVLQSSRVANQVTRIGRVICRDIEPGQKLEFRYAKRPAKDFCNFIESTPKAEIVAFFREIAEALEEHRQLEDFHLKIKDVKENFKVCVFYGDEKTGPEPLAPGQCISCFADIPLFPEMKPMVEARECILEEFRDQPHVLCRLDAKARSGFVITPVRHVERMSDLNNEELFALWSVAVRALRHAKFSFISMILNHGNYRNVHHLHLKVWVESELHQQYRKKWSDDRKEVWRRLQEFSLSRPKKEVECLFFKAHNQCRNGDLCSFLHVSQV